MVTFGSADGSKNDGPFCPVCFAKDKQLMPLRFRARAATPGLLTFACPQLHPAALGHVQEVRYAIRESLVQEGRYSLSS